MVKHTHQSTNCWIMFDHIVGLVLKGLILFDTEPALFRNMVIDVEPPLCYTSLLTSRLFIQIPCFGKV